jgi:hypothetical protein
MLYGFGDRRVSSGKSRLCRMSGQAISRTPVALAPSSNDAISSDVISSCAKLAGARERSHATPRSCITRHPLSASS